MTVGTVFDPIILFGDSERWWVGDGWHRILSAKKIGALTIDAELHEGGRIEALRYALKANDKHGKRRTNDDKRRCVEIALKEFAGLSSRQIADMCGVGYSLVQETRQVTESVTSTVAGADGKQYPARHKRYPKGEPHETANATENVVPETRPLNPPSNGLRYAKLAILNLKEIKPDDSQRAEAFASVQRWLAENLHASTAPVPNKQLRVVRSA